MSAVVKAAQESVPAESSAKPAVAAKPVKVESARAAKTAAVTPSVTGSGAPDEPAAIDTLPETSPEPEPKATETNAPEIALPELTAAKVTAPDVKAPEPKPVPVPEPQFRSPPKMPGHMQGMHGRPQIVPRAMAAKENFVEGDYVVYPTHGVGKVERIATEEIAGHKLELIHITFEENRMTLRVPVSKARTAGLRKLATRKVFDEALALLKGRARIKRTMWSRRAQEYEQKINSGDPMQIAEVVRDLHRNAGQPDQSFSERQIYEAAMDRLAAELAALDQTDKLTAATKLAEYLKTIQKGSAAELEPIEEEVDETA